MRAGMRGNVLLPKVIVRRVLDQVAKLARAAAAEQRLLQAIPCIVPDDIADSGSCAPAEAARSSAYASACSRRLRALRDFLEREYLPVCYDQVGWSQTSSGEAGYAYFARLFTTTDLTPQQIHELGLKEVARIRAEMERIKASTGFTGLAAGVLHVPAVRPAFLLQDAGGPARGLSRARQAHRPRADQGNRHAAATAVRCPPDRRCRRAEHDRGVRQSGRARRLARRPISS